jgi:hypothetical protein
MSDTPLPAPTHHKQALLRRLRELARERDPVPQHVTAAARSALAARGRADTEPAIDR